MAQWNGATQCNLAAPRSGDLRVVDGSWGSAGSLLSTSSGGTLATTNIYPSQLHLSLSWENSPAQSDASSIELTIGAQDAIQQGWLVRCYADGLVVVHRHGKPWWYRKFKTQKGAEQHLEITSTNAHMHLRYGDQSPVSIPVVSGVPAGYVYWARRRG